MSNPCPECGVDVNELTDQIDDLRIKLELAKARLTEAQQTLFDAGRASGSLIGELKVKCERLQAELTQLREFKQSVDRVLEVLQRMPVRVGERCVPPSHAGSISGSPDEPTQQDGARSERR